MIGEDQFYPTPAALAEKMLSKVHDLKAWTRVVLDPSGGRGDLLDVVRATWEETGGYRRNIELCAIEINPDLQAVLRNKQYRVLGSDFLQHSGMDQPDLVLLNPPFSSGASHMLQAMNMVTEGAIVCILNAETLRNACTKERKTLVRKLHEHSAEIEYLQQEFVAADRKTSVEVALIHLRIGQPGEARKRTYTEDMKKAEAWNGDAGAANQEVGFRDSMKHLIGQYNQDRERVIELILDVKKKPLPGFLTVSMEGNSFDHRSAKELINLALRRLRKDYWREAMMQPSIRKYLTGGGIAEFEKELTEHSDLDFTLMNLKIFLASISNGFTDLMAKTIEAQFDRMTYQHAWMPERRKNIHYFDGWKTNDAFKVNSRVILPINLYDNIWGRLSLKHYDGAYVQLEDLEKTVGYFSQWTITKPLTEAIQQALENGENRKIDSTLFEVSVFLKGTVHIRFKDLDAVRRLNIFVCEHKDWLPGGYGTSEYSEMSARDQQVVDSFEGREEYEAQRVQNNALGLTPKHLRLPALAA